MNFVAIDFETANSRRNSACSLGAAVVQDGEIVNTAHYLIQPYSLEFHPFNISLHGITPDDVSGAPHFVDVWDELQPIFGSLPVVAHNAAFDMSVIRYCLDDANRPYPFMEYLCTMNLAKALHPRLGCYRLDYLCMINDLILDKHHDALQDSVACALLLVEMCTRAGIGSIPDLKKAGLIEFGFLNGDRYKPCSIRKKYEDKNRDSEFEVEVIDDRFKGKNFVFTGALESMSRETAMLFVRQAGGNCQSSVTKKTNYLVSGMQNPIALRGHTMSTKMRRALELANSGVDIQIIQEDDFFDMIDADLWDKLLSATATGGPK